MSDWFYAQDEQQKGPMNEAELKEKIANQQLPATTLVWKEGMEEWVEAKSLPAFQFRAPPAPQAVTAAAPVSSAPPLTSTGVSPMSDSSDVEKNKVFAMLGYLGILFLVPLLAAKDSPFARFHANQGLILFILWIVVAFAIRILASIFATVPGFAVLMMLISLANLIPLALMVIGLVNAFKGEMKRLPIIGQYDLIR